MHIIIIASSMNSKNYIDEKMAKKVGKYLLKNYIYITHIRLNLHPLKSSNMNKKMS